MLRSHARVLLSYTAGVVAVGAVVWAVLLARPGVEWWNILYTSRNAMDALSSDGFIALRQIFVYPAFALGLPFRDAWRVDAAGQVRNLGPLLGIGLLFVVLPVICGVWLPFLVPVLYCFFGALCYVSFREIYLGIPENRPAVPAMAPVAVAAHQSPLSSRP